METTTNAPSPSPDLLTTEQVKNAWINREPIMFGDPVLAHVNFPYQREFYPLGFPVTVATNSDAVLVAAEQSWGRFTRTFHTESIRIEIGVTGRDISECPATPVCRMRDHLVTNIADGENFAICDLQQRSALIWVTEAALQFQSYFRYFFLESAAMCILSGVEATAIHAACVTLNDRGVLLCGDSGAGKSTLSYACARTGWTYITDDASYLVRGFDWRVAGNCHQIRFRPSAEELFPELSGLEIVRRAGVGKPSVELTPDANIQRANTACVKHIVFLKRGVQKQELVDFPRQVAHLIMEQSAFSMPFDVDRKLTAIDQLLTQEVYELRYNDLDWAITRLTQLVQEGRR